MASHKQRAEAVRIRRERQEALELLRDHQDYHKAEAPLRAAIEATQHQSNAETFMWMQRLAESLNGQKRFGEAEVQALLALRGFQGLSHSDIGMQACENSDPENEDVLDSMYLLAETRLALGKSADAGKVAQKALKGFIDNLKRGPEHHLTLKCRGLLALCLQAQDKNVEAAALAKHNADCLRRAKEKAVMSEERGSRRLTPAEQHGLDAASQFTEKVLSGRQDFEKPFASKRKMTAGSVSTRAPDSESGGESDGAISRNASKQSSVAPTGGRKAR